MIFKAILSNKAHPELGQATIPLPIRDSEYDHTIGLLEGIDNSMKLEPLYDGRHFPAYLYGLPQLGIEIKAGQDGAAAGFLCLPCSDLQIQRTMQRAGSGGQGFHMEITTDELPPQVSSLVSPDRDGLEELNALCRAIESLNAEQREKLDAVVLLARPNTPAKCASWHKTWISLSLCPSRSILTQTVR